MSILGWLLASKLLVKTLPSCQVTCSGLWINFLIKCSLSKTLNHECEIIMVVWAEVMYTPSYRWHHYLWILENEFTLLLEFGSSWVASRYILLDQCRACFISLHSWLTFINLIFLGIRAGIYRIYNYLHHHFINHLIQTLERSGELS